MNNDNWNTIDEIYNSFTSMTVAMIGNRKVKYDLCSSEYLQPLYDEKKFRYIGAGYIYSINGIKQSFGPDDVMHFWVHK